MKLHTILCLMLISSAAVAGGNAVVESTTLTVKNMTPQSLVIQSELMNGFIGNPYIQINSIADQTPSETVPSHGSGKFIISDDGMNGVVMGGISLCVQGTEACSSFPMWAGGDGQGHTIWINASLSSTSNSQYIVGAYEINGIHAVMNVYPAVKQKNESMIR